MRKNQQPVEMKRTWLVQRLNGPRTWKVGGKAVDNPFSFGGGLRNGGLSEEAMGLLREIFSFDYMGAAEFEFGAVPKALNGIAEAHKSLFSAQFTIPLAKVARGFRDKSEGEPDGDATIYVLCRKEHLTEVKQRIRAMAAKDYDFKEATRLPSTLRPSTEYDGETVGWLELDNGYFFFTDREMWAKTCDLFGVKVAAEATR